MMSASLLPDQRPRPPFMGSPWMMTLLFAVISVTLLGLWAARALAAPLSSFAKAAESFSLNGGTAPLPEHGPEEIRSVAKALNRMRERITGLIDDRTRMLAAISHDLRTPITRMRLRSEFIEDEAHRGRMLDDLDQMRSMLESVLSFLRNDRRLEAMTLVDIASTLQLVTDQFGDMGRNVVYDGPAHATGDRAARRPVPQHHQSRGKCRALRRGSRPSAFACRRSGLTIDVEDDGPGISDALKKNVLEPFVRGDDARNMDEAAGFGLGLSIARAIVLAHGGDVVAARPAAARFDRSDAIAGSAEPPASVSQRCVKGPLQAASGENRARVGCFFVDRDRFEAIIAGAAEPEERRPASDCFQPSRVAGSACHIGHRDFHGANSRNRIGP